ncbi:L-tyrosine decarboxylase [Mizuhopecten yessoensis]|uniref:L-tyrosine decarboxylase n=1 Tax=Mizuhopecten yessoensis TaxID=6573 RepID=A0A210QYQ3_MIZYE|nr:L-tyrosine decarboxylase [Mizuhopecten yessoensis]
MLDLQISMGGKIELYESEDFQGNKLQLGDDCTCIQLKGLEDVRSVKVIGKDVWGFYKNKGFRERSFELEEGDYPNLSAIKEEHDVISSVRPLWMEISEINFMPHGDKYHQQYAALAAWFLGPKGENKDIFTDLAKSAVEAHIDFRTNYYPTDKPYITDDIKTARAYRNEVKELKNELMKMTEELKETTPNHSLRYEGHMLWDTAMPANLGYIAALLYNSNNVTREASPVTTGMEIQVGKQICEMLGYSFGQKPEPWGHLTCGGSVANIEAMWSARNVKFYPVAIKKAVTSEEALKDALNYEVFVPRLDAKQKLTGVCSWDLLNLDIDDIIRIPEDMSKLGISNDVLADCLSKYSLQALGFFKFALVHGLTEAPVVVSPASNHYSWTKAATLLGIGSENLISVMFDRNARMSIDDLRQILNGLLERQVPVIAVVVVIGTTEHGAVDPLAKVINLRKEFREKGLNFCVCADAAWGGYFTSMLHSKTTSRATLIKDHGGYIPVFPLSPYTRKQLLHLKYADTITLDPHKSGYCPYPAGGLCYRNGAMRGFVQIAASVIYQDEAEPDVGMYGVEGSKPGAAAAGVLLAHRVIGLDMYGYGRILGQCMMGAKLFYCAWLTIANDDDNFVCVPMKPLPNEEDSGIPMFSFKKDRALQAARRFINDKIKGISNEHLKKDSDVMKFLSEIGPDALINAFAVNIRGNTDIDVTNQLNSTLFDKLSHTSVSKNDVKRVPLILTKSELKHSGKDKAAAQFKRRLGLPPACEGGLVHLINTVMNPWVADQESIQSLVNCFRQVVITTVEEMTDAPEKHIFIVASPLSKDSGEIFCDFYPNEYNEKESNYQAVLKFKVDSRFKLELLELIEQQVELALGGSATKEIIFRNKAKTTLSDMLSSGRQRAIGMDVFVGMESTTPVMTNLPVTISDVPLYRYFEKVTNDYPTYMTYFLFGDENGAYMTHHISVRPDFYQLVRLDQVPHSISPALLQHGIPVHISTMTGDPLYIDGEIVDPLQMTEYTVHLIAEGGTQIRSTVKFNNKHAKIFFLPLRPETLTESRNLEYRSSVDINGQV